MGYVPSDAFGITDYSYWVNTQVPTIEDVLLSKFVNYFTNTRNSTKL